MSSSSRGAGGEAWYWHRVVSELQSFDAEAIAVDLPAADDTAGWDEYAAAVERAIDGRTDVIRVAQSLARFTALIVTTRQRVDLIVLVNAMIPIPGETGAAWGPDTGSNDAELAYFARIGLPPEAADDVEIVYFHDVPADVVEETFQRGGANRGRRWNNPGRSRRGPTCRPGCSRAAMTGCFRSSSSGRVESDWGSRWTRSTAGTWSR